MAITVNSFPFESLLTSAKMTALQDTVIHVMSHFQLEHTFNASIVAGSHTNAVVYNENVQTITGSKVFTKNIHFTNNIKVQDQIRMGDSSSPRIEFSSNNAGQSLAWMGFEGTHVDKDTLFLKTNDVGSGISDDANDGSWIFGLGDEGFTRLEYKVSSGGAQATILSISTLGIMSAHHIPSAGRAFGGVHTEHDVTIGTSIAWGDVTGVVEGELHCQNLIINAGVTVTLSRNEAMRVFAIGSVTVNGAIDASGANSANPGPGQFDGLDGQLGGSGGGGGGGSGGGSSVGGTGGATFLVEGGAGGGVTTIGCEGGEPTFWSKLVQPNFTIGDLAFGGLFGGCGGNGGFNGPDSVGNGGCGGNLVYIETPLLQVTSGTGSITVKGGDGGEALISGNNDGGGGGGGGGTIWLRVQSFTTGDAASLTTSGGAGGAGSGAGAAGGVGGRGFVVRERVR